MNDVYYVESIFLLEFVWRYDVLWGKYYKRIALLRSHKRCATASKSLQSLIIVFIMQTAFRVILLMPFGSVNDKRTAAEVLPDTIANVNYKGDVIWSVPALFKSSCRLVVDKYPFDVQVGIRQWFSNLFELRTHWFQCEVPLVRMMTQSCLAILNRCMLLIS